MASNESCNGQSDTPPAMGRQEALDRFSKLEDSMAQIVSLLSSGPGTGSLPDSNECRPGSSTSAGYITTKGSPLIVTYVSVSLSSKQFCRGSSLPGHTICPFTASCHV
eukprot:gene1073-413_t